MDVTYSFQRLKLNIVISSNMCSFGISIIQNMDISKSLIILDIESWISQSHFYFWISVFVYVFPAGADVNACTPLGRTPLHVAAAMGHGHIVDLLLEKGRLCLYIVY